MYFFILILLFVCSHSLTTIQIIKTNIYEYSEIESVEEICEIILDRLRKNNIFIDSIDKCTNIQVESEFGSTLADVYKNYNRIAPRFLKQAEDNADAKRTQIDQFCDLELLFKRGLKVWALDNVPDLPINECYKDQLIRSRQSNCTILDETVPWYYDFELQPFDLCIHSLEETVAKRLIVRDVEEEQRTLPIRLDMDISNIWHYQMPEKLKAVSKTLPGLKYP